MNSYYHAVSSSRTHGGTPEDYITLHSWFDESKAHMADVRHRALRHHTEGIFMAEKIFGVTLKNSVGKTVPVRILGEQHVKEDLGFIPSVKDWLQHIALQPWMAKAGTTKLERELLKKDWEETKPLKKGIDDEILDRDGKQVWLQ
jgi:hypothetical protein